MTLTGGATHGGGNSRRHGSAQQHHSEAIVIEEIACGHPIDAIEQTARKTQSRFPTPHRRRESHVHPDTRSH